MGKELINFEMAELGAVGMNRCDDASSSLAFGVVFKGGCVSVELLCFKI